MVVPLAAAALACLATWFIVARPLASADVATRSQQAPARTPVAHAVGPTCRPGPPRRVVYPDLGVDATVERIGLESAASTRADGTRRLGNPTDISRIGWYADGPKPGSGTGTVLLDGHTYRDGSAVFGEDFPSRVRAGQLVQTVQQDGSVCSYRVDRVWPAIDARQDYPRIVASEHLYDPGGPERLFLATCGGRWNDAREDYDDITVLVATALHH